MLKKCLKYDLKETFKLWWAFGITAIVLATVTGVLFGAVMSFIESTYVTLFFLPLPLFWFLTVLFMGLACITPYIRYYKNFFGKESYLTFTLPVKRSTLFGSKVLSGLLYNALSSILPITCLLGSTVLVSLLSSFPNSDVLSVEYLPVLVVLLLYGLLILGILLTSVLECYLIITFCGVYFKKYSLFIIIAAFYLLGNFGSILSMIPIGSLFLFIGGAVGLSNAGVLSMGPLQYVSLEILGVSLLAIIFVIVTLLLAFLNLELLERKLNVT